MARLHTVGHSDRSAGAFLEILRAHDVELLVDVRRHPGSRRHPHFNRDQLRATLADAGLGYRHEEALGGRRSPEGEDRTNAGWRSDGFRAYADHLVARGHEVVHLLGPDRGRTHRLRGMAEVREDRRVVYPPGDGGQTELFDDDPAAGEAGP